MINNVDFDDVGDYWFYVRIFDCWCLSYIVMLDKVYGSNYIKIFLYCINK